ACLTSGRSCSLARSVFFKAVAVTDEPLRKRRGINESSRLSRQISRQLRHRDVVLVRHTSKQKLPIWLHLGMAAPASRLRRNPTALAIRLHQQHDERDRYPEMCGRLMAGMTGLHIRNDPFT